MTECEKYARAIANDLIAIYDGTTEERNEDGEPVSFYDWLCTDVLDYETVHNSRKDLIGAYLYVTIGGPCCYIDTHHNKVVTNWGTETGIAWLPHTVSDGINECMRDMEM